MRLYMNYIDRTELLNDAPDGFYDGLDDAQLDRMISLASAIMRRETRGALYAVDEAGMPTNERIIDAFKYATSAQVQAWVEADITDQLSTGGATSEALVASSSNNGSSVTMDYSESTKAREHLLSGGLALGALLLLEDAGLTSGKPWLVV
ncbi:hypothetical protein [Corynebacterium sp. KPL2825]|uniref:hypothetical protein n=1 Tax=Corynebacterium sp. KPL2825 TaxID=3135444 RepID=UPI0030C90C7A